MCDDDYDDDGSEEECLNCLAARTAISGKMNLLLTPSTKMICGNAHECLAIDAEFPEQCDSAVEHDLHPTCALSCLGHVCVPIKAYKERRQDEKWTEEAEMLSAAKAARANIAVDKRLSRKEDRIREAGRIYKYACTDARKALIEADTAAYTVFAKARDAAEAAYEAVVAETRLPVS